MQVRRKELELIGRSALIKTLNISLVFAVPPLIALVIFATYVYSNADAQGHLTPAMSFVVLSLFNTLRFPLVVLPKALRGVSGDAQTDSSMFACFIHTTVESKLSGEMHNCRDYCQYCMLVRAVQCCATHGSRFCICC